MQAPEFWSSLVPDETLRNAVSRQHFEISSKGEKLMLTNLSLAGTLVNGHMVQQQHKVQHGDVVAILSTAVCMKHLLLFSSVWNARGFPLQLPDVAKPLFRTLLVQNWFLG